MNLNNTPSAGPLTEADFACPPPRRVWPTDGPLVAHVAQHFPAPDAADLHQSDEASRQISQQTAATARRVEPAAWLFVLLLWALLGVAAALHYLTPCEAATCSLAAAPLRALQHAWLRLRAAYLQLCIRMAKAEIEALQDDMIAYHDLSPSQQDHLLTELISYKKWRDHHRVSLAMCHAQIAVLRFREGRAVR